MQRIQVVEDEPAISDMIAYALRTDGFDVIRSSTGEDATHTLAVLVTLTAHVNWDDVFASKTPALDAPPLPGSRSKE